MRIESSVTAISWIPSEAVEGLPKIPFTMGVAHYDDPPPDVIEDLDAMREADAFREANELRAYIEVAEDGSITDAGHLGSGHLGVTRIKVGPKELSVAAVALMISGVLGGGIWFIVGIGMLRSVPKTLRLGEAAEFSARFSAFRFPR